MGRAVIAAVSGAAEGADAAPDVAATTEPDDDIAATE